MNNEREEHHMQTILLATDGSQSAQRATEIATELAKATGWRLHVVAVWHIPLYDYGYVPLGLSPELIEAAREHAGTVVKAAVEAARKAGVTATSEFRQGDAVDEICAAASESSADLIVVGAHGWGALKRIVLGSVSTAVLHSAPCPVVVVRGETESAQREVVGAGSAYAG
jgi:nucleotide-binding universal stress UspA family protein